jgi:hypothetical protein
MSKRGVCPKCKQETDHSDYGFLLAGRHIGQCRGCGAVIEYKMTTTVVTKTDPVRKLIK